MNIRILSVILIFTCLTVSCKKENSNDDNVVTKKDSLTGNWKLSQNTWDTNKNGVMDEPSTTIVDSPALRYVIEPNGQVEVIYPNTSISQTYTWTLTDNETKLNFFSDSVTLFYSFEIKDLRPNQLILGGYFTNVDNPAGITIEYGWKTFTK